MTTFSFDSTNLNKRVDEVLMPTYSPMPLIPAKASGSQVEDSEGRHYLDLAGGIAVTSLGHCHPALVKALTEQAQQLWHMSNVFANEPALALAEKLTELTFADQVFFSNSGAEANEAALKLARRYSYNNFGADKHEIVTLNRSFHGRTLFTVAAGGTPAYSNGFGPVPQGIVHVEANDTEALSAAVGPTTAAVFLEPIIAEGGVIPLDAAYLDLARNLCDEKNALLVFDEVQTGAGRTGTLYAYEQLGVTPDIMTSAKGLGGGFPIGATLARADIAASLVKGTHGTTHGGNPLATAVASAAIGEIAKPELLANVKARSEQLRNGLEEIKAETKIFSEVRGNGLLIGAEMSEPYLGKAPDLQLEAAAHGVLTLVAGANVCRLTPALNITEAEAETGLGRLAEAAKAVVKEAGA